MAHHSQPVQIHPFVEVLAHQLVPTNRNDVLTRLVFTDVGLKKAEEMLRSLFDKPAEFNLAVQALNLFIEYLRTERESPNAARALTRVIEAMVDEQYECNLKREIEQREKVGQQFGRFIDKKQGSEADLPKSGPVIPAKDLLRGHIKR